jgi:chromosome segregation ATPase
MPWALLRQTWFWVGAAVGLLLIVLWLQYGGWVSSWLRGVQAVREEGALTRDEIESLQGERTRLQVGVRDLSQKILLLTNEAKLHRERAEREQRARLALERQLGGLRAQLDDLAQRREALVPIDSITGAFNELRRLGY